MVRQLDGVGTGQWKTGHGGTECQACFAGAGDTRVSLPGLSLAVVHTIVLCASSGVTDHRWEDCDWQRRADWTALSLGNVPQIVVTPHIRTCDQFTGLAVGV